MNRHPGPLLHRRLAGLPRRRRLPGLSPPPWTRGRELRREYPGPLRRCRLTGPPRRCRLVGPPPSPRGLTDGKEACADSRTRVRDGSLYEGARKGDIRRVSFLGFFFAYLQLSWDGHYHIRVHVDMPHRPPGAS